MYYVYDDESDVVQYNIFFFYRDICKWMVGEKDRE